MLFYMTIDSSELIDTITLELITPQNQITI